MPGAVARGPPSAAQPRVFIAQAALQLGLPEAQHASQFVRRHRLFQQTTNLLQAKPGVLQRQGPVQARELRGGIVAIARVAVDRLGLEQTRVAILAQRLDRHLRQTTELTDLEHAAPLCTRCYLLASSTRSQCTPSSKGRVKGCTGDF
jgi:hypothetical protein